MFDNAGQDCCARSRILVQADVFDRFMELLEPAVRAVAVGDPRALDLALRLTRKCGTVQAIGVYAERCEVHMGLLWIKALRLHTGHANVIGHVDSVLAMMSAGLLDPTPLVSNHMSLEEAPEAYRLYDRREALKIVLRP